MKSAVYFFLLNLFFNGLLLSQTTFIESIGKSNSDVGTSFCVSSKGNFVISSTSNSYSTDDDILISMINSNADIVWNKHYGGSSNETAVDIEAVESGFIILGNSQSYTNGNSDLIVIKIDSVGNPIWSKVYGGIQDDFAGCIKRVPSGGYIIVGRTQSFGQGSDDGWVLRINDLGEIIWSKAYGTYSNDRFYDVSNTKDNGFILTGIQKNLTSGFYDQVIIKLDSIGNVIFSKNYGDGPGTSNDAGDCIKELLDGGFILSGQSRAFGLGGEDMCVTKIDSLGNLVWSKVFGNSQDDRAFDFDINTNGDLILAGYTQSFGAGGYDAFLTKLNSQGEPYWFAVYGKNNDDVFNEVRVVDENYLMVGYTNSFGSGGNDILIVKTDTSASNSLNCSNINVIEKNVTPSELEIIQNVVDGGFAIDVDILNSTVVIDTSSFEKASFVSLDSIYYKGYYNILLDGTPSGGSFYIDGIDSSIFVPSNLGIHRLVYKVPVSDFCWTEDSTDVNVIQGCRYYINDNVISCTILDNVCISLNALYPFNRGMQSLDFCLTYDSTVLSPSNTYQLGDIITHGHDEWVDVNFEKENNGKLRVIISYNDLAPSSTYFEGEGEIICINFIKSNNKISIGSYPLEICSLIEQAFDNDSVCWNSGELSIIGSSNLLNGILVPVNLTDDSLFFKYSNTLIKLYDVNNHSQSLSIDSIPFSLTLPTSDRLYFDADLIDNVSSASSMKYINGFDTYQMENVIANKTNAPLQMQLTPFALIAADVDLSDKVRSNDVSMLQERIVRKITEYDQQIPIEVDKTAVDWRFVEQSRVEQSQDFHPSEYFPLYSPKGYCRDNVPDIPFFLENQGSCDGSFQETYHAILLGDVTGESAGINWDNFTTQQSKVALAIDDFNDLGNDTYRVFLQHTLSEQDQLYAIDLVIDYQEDSLRFQQMDMITEDPLTSPRWMYNDYEEQELLLTSYTMTGYPLSGNLMYFDFQKMRGSIVPEDLGTIHVFLNGQEVPSSVVLKSQTSTGIENSQSIDDFIQLYPNPADQGVTINLPKRFREQAAMVLINNLGQTVKTSSCTVEEDKWYVDLQDLSSGLYQCVIAVQGKQPVVKKLIIR